MKQPKAPCLGCNERFLGCHSLCDKYIKFKRESEIFRAEKMRIIKENEIMNDIEKRRIRLASEGRFYRSGKGRSKK